MRICLAAGGTGGHLLPGVSTAKELKRRGHEVHFIIRTDPAAQAFLAREGFGSTAFYFEGFPRSLSSKALSFPFFSATALWNARKVLRREDPAVVLGMGGYISVPVGLSAFFRRIPVVIHEQNSRAGLANRLLSRWACAVGTTFEETKGFPGRIKPVTTGLPIRSELAPIAGDDARRSLGLDPKLMTFLVFGGSQGAHALNDLVTRSLAGLASRRDKWQFIHLCGEPNRGAVESAYKSAGFRAFVRGYWSEMAVLYSAADFVVSRAGANTVMELARFGKRSLLVPFPFATDNHQEANARYFESSGLSRMVRQSELTPERFTGILESLPDAEALREENRRRLETVPETITQGASRLADLVESVVKRREA